MSFLSVLEKIHIQKNKNLKYYQRLFSDISVDIIVTPCIKLHIVSINCFVFYERFFFGVVIIKHIKFQNILKQTFLFYYHRLVSPQPASKLPKIPHKNTQQTKKQTDRHTICKQTKHIFSHHVGTLFLIKVKKKINYFWEFRSIFILLFLWLQLTQRKNKLYWFFILQGISDIAVL